MPACFENEAKENQHGRVALARVSNQHSLCNQCRSWLRITALTIIERASSQTFGVEASSNLSAYLRCVHQEGDQRAALWSVPAHKAPGLVHVVQPAKASVVSPGDLEPIASKVRFGGVHESP